MIMASFVTEVLASSGKLEKEDLTSKISKLSRKVKEVKEEVCDMMDKRYCEFLPSMQEAEALVGQADDLAKEINSIKSCIETEVQENLHVAVTEYARLKEQLGMNTTIIDTLRHLFEFHSGIEASNKALQEKEYVIAAKQLEKAQASTNALKAWKGSELPLLRALSSEFIIQRENLIYHLGEEWKRLVVWHLPGPSKELTDVESFLKTELHLSLGNTKDVEPGPSPLLCGVLQALAILGELQYKIKLFSQVLLKNMLKPLISHPSLNVNVAKQGEGTLISLQSLKTPEEHPSPSQVYTKVLVVLQTLHTHLLDVSVGEEKVSLILGDLVWEEMSHCIIHECLLYSIPADSSELENYSVVIKKTEEFEKSLKEMQCLRGDSTELLAFARNVNCHFAHKKCKDVIVAARKLMTSEMHNTIKITPDSKLSIPKLPKPSSGGDKGKQEGKKPPQVEVRLENEKQLGEKTLCLPTCRISVSVQQLMELALHTLSEASGGSSRQCAIQLFFTVRNIFQLFYDVVPTYHKENLLKFPHLAAIQHNNCMYIAHHLLTLGHQFRPHLPEVLSRGTATFVDLVPGFRKLGAQCFLAQLNVQRAEMLERLSTARGFNNLDDTDNYSAASKAVRQVIHQLKRLGTVWQDVLPVTIYCKAMGTLLNTAISEIMVKIMMLEDISTEDGANLHTLCQTVIEEGPLVFIPLPEENKNRKYQEELPVYVKRWMAFKELAIVLQANMQDIVDRWAEGKGLLAMEFTSSEMKSLIRALFQNTERRSIALSKIK